MGISRKFPQILEDEVVGEAATALWQDTQERLAWLIEDGRLQAKGVILYLATNQLGTDDIPAVLQEAEILPLIELTPPSSASPKPDDLGPNLCLTRLRRTLRYRGLCGRVCGHQRP